MDVLLPVTSNSATLYYDHQSAFDHLQYKKILSFLLYCKQQKHVSEGKFWSPT